jgi:cytoskeletal protein CcmA (bactofilin family)
MKKDLNESETASQTDTIIGASVKVKGTLFSEGNIEVHGEVEGEIKTNRDVFIGEGAKITADISAANAEIAGRVKGNVGVAEHLKLAATAEVRGDISAKMLAVDPGATFVGRSQMTREASSGTAPEKSPKLTPKYEVE